MKRGTKRCLLALAAIIGAALAVGVLWSVLPTTDEELIANLRACPDLMTRDPDLSPCLDAVDQFLSRLQRTPDRDVACTVAGLWGSRTDPMTLNAPVACWIDARECPEVRLLVLRGDSEAALIAADACLPRIWYEDLRPNVLYWQAMALARLGRPQEAVEAMAEAVAMEPNAVPLRLMRAKLLLMAGDPVAALADIEAARALSPRSAQTDDLACSAHARAGQWPAAETACTDAIARGIKQNATRFLRACARYKLGDFERAIADLDLVIKNAPSLPDAFALRSLARADAGQHELAVRDAESVTALTGDTTFDVGTLCGQTDT